MTTEQHQGPDLKAHLMEMGFSPFDAQRAVNAGHIDVYQAIEFLSAKPVPPPEKSERDFPTLRHLEKQPTSETSSPIHGRTLTNARDSFDRIDVNRITESGPVAPRSAQDSLRDDDLEKVLEISRREEDERKMKRAMEISKEEREAAVQRQDQDPEYMLAVQESLKVDQRAPPDRAVSWQSHGFADAKERVRKGPDDPVGLKNIGNTCYLNSLLQVYYHLPEFRRAVMAFRPPEDFLQASVTDSKPLPDTIPVQEPTVETPEDEMDKEESPEERLERKIDEAQLEQTFEALPNTDEWMKPAEGASSVNASHEEDKEADSLNHAVQFVVELQRLFAAMALGKQNCVDPSGVAHAMRDSDGKPIVIGAQQDASEFNHLFLDIVEEGLRSKSTEEMPALEERDKSADSEMPSPPVVRMADGDITDNVVKDMFTTRFRQEIRRIACADSAEPSQQPAVTINGETNAIIVDATSKSDRNLHSGLDDYAYAQIDYKFDEASKCTTAPVADARGIPLGSKPILPPSPAKFGLEKGAVNDADASPAMKTVWFTRMPPVFVIYLQRVVYNLKTNQAEKVHDRFEFSSEMAFDRYLEENRDAAISARGVVLSIREERKSLRSMLNSYEMFPVSEGDAGARTMSDGASQKDVEMQNPSDVRRDKAGSIVASGGASRGDPPEKRRVEFSQDFFSAARRVQARLAETLNPSSPHFVVENVSEDKVHTALETLTAVVEQDRKRCNTLKENLRRLEKDESEAYSDLARLKYHLHAVLVHDGAPSGGHYWTFIRNWNSQAAELNWMKLSDSAVSFVSEEEMLVWSVGGRSRASAYCLIYALASNVDSKYKNGMKSIAEESRELLPISRIEELDLITSEFERELQEQAAIVGK